MITYTCIKKKYTYEGYLPNYPYHLISDREMCEAFLPIDKFMVFEDGTWHIENSDWAEMLQSSGEYYFVDNYPLLDISMQPVYKQFVYDMMYHIDKFLTDIDYKLPSWITSYMLGEVVGPNSKPEEIHDMLVSLGADNIDDEFTTDVAKQCINISKQCILRSQKEEQFHKSPTLFADLDVIKYLATRQLR